MIDPIADRECRTAKQALINSYQNLLFRERASLAKAKAVTNNSEAIARSQNRVDKLAAIVSQLLGT